MILHVIHFVEEGVDLGPADDKTHANDSKYDADPEVGLLLGGSRLFGQFQSRIWSEWVVRQLLLVRWLTMKVQMDLCF